MLSDFFYYLIIMIILYSKRYAVYCTYILHYTKGCDIIFIHNCSFVEKSSYYSYLYN